MLLQHDMCPKKISPFSVTFDTVTAHSKVQMCNIQKEKTLDTIIFHHLSVIPIITTLRYSLRTPEYITIMTSEIIRWLNLGICNPLTTTHVTTSNRRILRPHWLWHICILLLKKCMRPSDRLARRLERRSHLPLTFALKSAKHLYRFVRATHSDGNIPWSIHPDKSSETNWTSTTWKNETIDIVGNLLTYEFQHWAFTKTKFLSRACAKWIKLKYCHYCHMKNISPGTIIGSASLTRTR